MSVACYSVKALFQTRVKLMPRGSNLAQVNIFSGHKDNIFNVKCGLGNIVI